MTKAEIAELKTAWYNRGKREGRDAIIQALCELLDVPSNADLADVESRIINRLELIE